MQCQFKWETSIAKEAQEGVEERLRYDFATHPPMQTCHKGVTLVTLSVSGPFLNAIEGSVKCACGKAIGTVKGELHGFEFKFESA